MNKFMRRERIVLAAALLSAAFAVPAFAYESDDKAIRNVSISVSGTIEVDSEMGDEALEISCSGNKYDYDHYEVQNVGFRWSEDDVPDIKIYLTADDGYYFHITRASQIRLNGATYVSAAREDSAYTLAVEVKLPSLATQVADVTEATMTADGICTWEEAAGSGSYEVKFMRNGTTLGGVQTVTGTTFDGSRYMTKPSTGYHFMVRGVNKTDSSIKGHWFDSNKINVTDAMAEAQREKNANEESAGTWNQENGRWTFTLPDGTLMKDGWRQINGSWYQFDEKGYMRTGWYLDAGKWYYLDPTTGAMWRNAKTPDGYEIGIDGSMATGDESAAGLH